MKIDKKNKMKINFDDFIFFENSETKINCYAAYRRMQEHEIAQNKTNNYSCNIWNNLYFSHFTPYGTHRPGHNVIQSRKINK